MKLYLITFFSCVIFSCESKCKQIAKIDYQFSGCFGSEKSTLTIYLNDTILMAKLEDYETRTLKAKLTASQLDTFKTFYTELKSLRGENGCTTVSHYEVFYKNELFHKTDGGCNWNGFEKLTNCLFSNPLKLGVTN